MKKVVLFDLDGTLIDSAEGITRSAQYALGHFGIEEKEIERLRFFIGPPLMYTFQEKYGFSPEKAREAIEKYRERYNAKGIFECALYPGVKECLRELRQRGYWIGLASSKPEVACRRILEHFEILEYFDEVAGATLDGRIDTKEQVLQELFRRAGDCAKEDMILIGDTMFDIHGANQVGIRSAAVDFGFGNANEMLAGGAVFVCKHLQTLPQLLEEYYA